MASSLTTNVDIYVIGDEPARPAVVRHAHVVMDDEMTSSKVAAPNSSVISGNYGGSKKTPPNDPRVL